MPSFSVEIMTFVIGIPIINLKKVTKKFGV